MMTRYLEPQIAINAPAAARLVTPWDSYRAGLRRLWRRTRSGAAFGVQEFGRVRVGGLDMIGALLLAGFAAIILHPLVYGNLGDSVMSLMTPVR